MENQKEKVCILAVVESPYAFDKDGKHLEGVSYKAVLAYYPAGKKNPRAVEVVKMPNDKETVEKALNARGQYFDGVCMFDRFGRFVGIG